MLRARPALEVECVTIGKTEVAYAAWFVCTDEAGAREVQAGAEKYTQALEEHELRANLLLSIPRGPVTRPDAVEAMFQEAKETQGFTTDGKLAAWRSYRVKRAEFDRTMTRANPGKS